MKIQFEVLRISRDLVIKELEGLTLGQIHEVPAGFKNVSQKYNNRTALATCE